MLQSFPSKLCLHDSTISPRFELPNKIVKIQDQCKKCPIFNQISPLNQNYKVKM
jgi:hypothetical protein